MDSKVEINAFTGDINPGRTSSGQNSQEDKMRCGTPPSFFCLYGWDTHLHACSNWPEPSTCRWFSIIFRNLNGSLAPRRTSPWTPLYKITPGESRNHVKTFLCRQLISLGFKERDGPGNYV